VTKLKDHVEWTQGIVKHVEMFENRSMANGLGRIALCVIVYHDHEKKESNLEWTEFIQSSCCPARGVNPLYQKTKVISSRQI
jgi:hypothetical protein